MQQQGQHGNEDDTEGVKTTMAFTCLRIDGEVPTALRSVPAYVNALLISGELVYSPIHAKSSVHCEVAGS